jgi:hypothetical protein
VSAGDLCLLDLCDSACCANPGLLLPPGLLFVSAVMTVSLGSARSAALRACWLHALDLLTCCACGTGDYCGCAACAVCWNRALPRNQLETGLWLTTPHASDWRCCWVRARLLWHGREIAGVNLAAGAKLSLQAPDRYLQASSLASRPAPYSSTRYLPAGLTFTSNVSDCCLMDRLHPH